MTFNELIKKHIERNIKLVNVTLNENSHSCLIKLDGLVTEEAKRLQDRERLLVEFIKTEADELEDAGFSADASRFRDFLEKECNTNKS